MPDRQQTIENMAEGADNAGVSMSHIGRHFGEEQRVAGLGYAQLLTLMRIADALERIADSADANSTGGAQG